ncbi:MAG: two-component regulator propeller domain-containing protein [Pelobium sp.]
MLTRFIILLVLFTLQLPAKVGAQQQRLIFQHINIEEGLSNSAVESICKDSYGLMWFGTRNGLNRYDGTRITVFRNDIHNNGSIGDNLIRDIYEDKQKRLWIATNRGLELFNQETETFKHFSPTNEKVGIWTICEDSKGKLWMGTSAGLMSFDPEQKKFIKQPISKGGVKLTSGRINKITEDKKGNLWIGTEQGIYRLNIAKDQFKYFTARKGDPTALQGSRIHDIFQDSRGRIWIGMSEGGLALYNEANGGFKTYQTSSTAPSENLAHNDVDCITEGAPGILWIGTENGGLSIFDVEKGVFSNYQPNLQDPGSISHNSIHALYKDNHNNIWIGTWAGGINLFSPSKLKFPLYNKFINSPAIGIESILCDSKGIIWMGAVGNSLYRYDPVDRKYTYFLNPNSAQFQATIYAIKEFNNDSLVLATRRGGMAFFDKNTHTFTHLRSKRGDSTSIAGNELITVCVDSEKNVWCGGWEIGLSRYNRSTKKFTNYYPNPSDPASLSSNQIYTIFEDHFRNIWIGTEDGGLELYNRHNDTFTHFVSKSGDRNSIGSNTVFSLFEDSKGRFWVGTSNGLNLFDRKNKTFKSYSGKNGLPNDAINSIEEDVTGKLWLGTDRGLYAFDPKNNSVKQFHPKDGLQDYTFLHNATARDQLGNLYFSGYKGLNIFDPAKLQYNEFIPQVILTSLSIENKKVQIGSENPKLLNRISQLKELVLSYRHSVFSLDFAALSYSSPENNQYAYKMEGFDKNWNFIGSSHTATYTKLDPGEYTFRVIASNSDGLWNKQGASLKIIITPPFWKTWWFITLVFLLIGYVAFILLSYRRKQELRALEEAKRSELQALKLKFFTNISHELRTPLSLIIGPLETLLGNKSIDNTLYYYNIMMRNVNRLMNLVNELMDFSKIEAGALKLKVSENNLTSFVTQIAEDYRAIATERKITYELNITVANYAWFDRQMIEKIILNLISNAFKYTKNGGNVKVAVIDTMEKFEPHFENILVLESEYRAENYLFFSVMDSGIGISKETISQLFERYYRIPTAHLGSGVGLAFVKSLTFLHKGKIFVSSDKNKGTEIIIAVPSSKRDYLPSEITTDGEISVQLESLQVIDEMPPSEQPTDEQIDKEEHTDNTLKHILLVDDNEELRQFLKNSLKDQYVISEASNGLDGLSKAKEIFPDLIISDVMMPDMDGLQFCKELKDDLEISHIPFLLLTAKGNLDAEIEGIGAGADFYFKKPVSLKLLNLTLRNIFIQKQKLIDRYTKNYQAEVKELVHTSKDKILLDKLMNTIESQLLNPELDIDFLCVEIGMSRTSLYNKIKGLTGLSLVDFLRKIRLRKALDILLKEDVQISQVMYRVGIQSQSHFTRAFKKEFGKTPSQYLKEVEKKDG